LLVVAPITQQTAAGRSKPSHSSGRLTRVEIHVHDKVIQAFGVDASPAQAVEHALFELAPRPVNLVVSGINYGENVGEGLAVSGTLGAAIEGASFGIPALALSRQTDPVHFLNHRAELDFSVAAHFLRQWAAHVLAHSLPAGVDVLKIDVPDDASPERLAAGRVRAAAATSSPCRRSAPTTTTRRRWVSCCAPTPSNWSRTATCAP
jgi:5'-nucleotidase